MQNVNKANKAFGMQKVGKAFFFVPYIAAGVHNYDPRHNL